MHGDSPLSEHISVTFSVEAIVAMMLAIKLQEPHHKKLPLLPCALSEALTAYVKGKDPLP